MSFFFTLQLQHGEVAPLRQRVRSHGDGLRDCLLPLCRLLFGRGDPGNQKGNAGAEEHDV